MSLSHLPNGANAKIKCIKCKGCIRNRLFALGLLPGTHIEILQNNPFTPLIISVRNTRLTLDRKLASLIQV